MCAVFSVPAVHLSLSEMGAIKDLVLIHPLLPVFQFSTLPNFPGRHTSPPPKVIHRGVYRTLGYKGIRGVHPPRPTSGMFPRSWKELKCHLIRNLRQIRNQNRRAGPRTGPRAAGRAGRCSGGPGGGDGDHPPHPRRDERPGGTGEAKPYDRLGLHYPPPRAGQESLEPYGWTGA